MRVLAALWVTVAWLAFLASLALPATDETNGYEACVWCLVAIPFSPIVLVLGQPGMIVIPACGLGNVVMLVSPWVIFKLRENAWLAALILVMSGVPPWLLPVLVGGHFDNLRFGYYLWAASFVLMAVGGLLVAAAEWGPRRRLLASLPSDSDVSRFIDLCMEQRQSCLDRPESRIDK
jgi:hypothetical protein